MFDRESESEALMRAKIPVKCIFERHLSKSGIRRLVINFIRARTRKITFQLTKHHRNEHDRYNIALHCELGVQLLIRSINFVASLNREKYNIPTNDIGVDVRKDHRQPKLSVVLKESLGCLWKDKP